jgi:hypothetical protein
MTHERKYEAIFFASGVARLFIRLAGILKNKLNKRSKEV